MSLQVWLPLNGTMENQGLLNLTPTQQGTISWIDGKIGKCLSAGNASQTINGISYNTNLVNELGENFSIALWVKPLGNHVHYNGTFISSGNWNNSCWSFGVSQDNSQVDVLCKGYNTYLTCAVPINTWTHLTCVHSGTTTKLYKNGEYIGEKTGVATTLASDATNFCVGRETYSSGYFSFNGNLNDIRIYDHTLSAKEVKELSKGLILHYKLNGAFETTTNLCTTDDGLSSTAYNAANGKYGYNADSNIQKTVGDFNGRHCTKVSMITAGQSSRPYVYFSNIFVSNGTNQPTYKTLSFDYYGTIGTYVNFYKLGNGSGTGAWKSTDGSSSYSGSWTNSGNITVVPNKWNHIELILRGTTDANAEFGYCILGDTHTSATNNYWLFANVQIENKDHATPYVGVGGSRTYNVEYDCSGYGYNGTIGGNLTSSSETKRYNSSIVIPSGGYIGLNTLPSVESMQNCTFSFWMKTSTPGNTMCLWNGRTTTGGPIALFALGGTFRFDDGTQHTLSYTIPTNIWEHYCVTRDGSNIKLYVNGALKVTQTSTSFTTVGTKGTIGASSTNTATGSGNTFVGQLNDYRIYATALSADDVRELYQTSASIDNHGNIYAYELEEV